jgi:hypothetical protein
MVTGVRDPVFAHSAVVAHIETRARASHEAADSLSVGLTPSCSRAWSGILFCLTPAVSIARLLPVEAGHSYEPSARLVDGKSVLQNALSWPGPDAARGYSATYLEIRPGRNTRPVENYLRPAFIARPSTESGAATEGADSIVVSGGYEDDEDCGV